MSCSLLTCRSVRLSTSIPSRYSLIDTDSLIVCALCGSPGPYVTTGMLMRLPMTFMSPVPVFRMSIGLAPFTDCTPRLNARTSGESCGASNASVSSSIE